MLQGNNMHKQSDIQSVHYARIKHDALRTLLYAELLKDRTNGRWENKPELASKYVEGRKKTEQVYRDKLKAIGVNVPDDQSFLYSTIPGREKFNPGKGYYQHNFNINDEDLKRTLFDVVGLPDKLLHPDGPQLGQAGYDDAIARWDKHKKILGKSKYMGMTINPRIEVISPHGNTGYANLMKQSGNVLAHIGGASGAGKTHLLEALKAKYPHLNTKDLDEFDEQGEKDLGYKHIRKKDYNDEMLALLAGKRQELMDKYIQGNDNIVLGGHHTEADHVLKIPTANKMLLDRGPLRSSIQGYIRSQISGQHPRSIFDLRSDYAEANDTIRDLKKDRYKPQSYNEILNNNMFKKAALRAGYPEMIIKSIEDIKNRKYLYHGSAQKLDVLDPKFNQKYNYGYEYGDQVAYAADKPSSAFTNTPTPEYLAMKEKIKNSVYHRLIDPSTGRKLLLGHTPNGYMHVFPASHFKKITREDKELGQTITSSEYVSDKPVKPLRTYKMRKRDVDAIPEYEFLGEENVGEMNVQDYLSKAKDPKVISAIKAWINKGSMNKEAKTVINDHSYNLGLRPNNDTSFLDFHAPRERESAFKMYSDYQNQDIAGDFTFRKNIPNGILSLMGHGGGKTDNYSLGGGAAGDESTLLSDILKNYTGKKPSLLEVIGCNGDGACIDKIIGKSPLSNVPRRTYGTPGHISTTDTANAARSFAITQKQPWLIPTKEEFVREAHLTGRNAPSHTAEIRPVIPTSVSIPVGIGLAAAGGLAGLYYWNKKRKKDLENNMNKEAILRGFNKRAADVLPPLKPIPPLKAIPPLEPIPGMMHPDFMTGLTNAMNAPEHIQTKILQFLQAAPTKQYSLTTPTTRQGVFNNENQLKTNYTSWGNNDAFTGLKKTLTDGLKNPKGPGETILNFNKALTKPESTGERLLPHVFTNPANAGVSNLFHEAFQMAPNASQPALK